MARPNKETVDYYPHFVKSGRTIFILESKYGNDGYAFWFKLLEILGEADGHWLDCSVPTNWAYLLAKTRCNEETAKGIIGTLLTLGKIDCELWNNRQVIWCQNFVNNVSNVYKMRRADVPARPSLSQEEPQGVRVSDTENPKGSEFIHKETDIVKESKEKERKGEKRIYPCRDIAALWNDICGGSLPRVKAVSENRRQKIKCRCEEWGKDNEAWLQQARELFERVIASDFLRGDNKSGWIATFDWLFENSKNWIKVMEGNYDNKRGLNTGRTGAENSLGVGEYIDGSGRRTYGTGRADIPMNAAPRPSERYSWDEASKSWVML